MFLMFICLRFQIFAELISGPPQFPRQQRWNCWTCIVKANTVMGLLKTQGAERRRSSLPGCSCCIGCVFSSGEGQKERERGRERVEGGGQHSCWGGERECPLVASADNSTSARAVLLGEQSTGSAEDWAAERRAAHLRRQAHTRRERERGEERAHQRGRTEKEQSSGKRRGERGGGREKLPGQQ